MTFDLATLINWIVFAIVTGFVAFLFNEWSNSRRRKAEQEQLKDQFAHERGLQREVLDAKVREINEQIRRQRTNAILHEVLPTAMQFLEDALGAYAVVGPGYKQYADLHRMPEPEWRYFLAQSRLSPPQQDQVAKAQNRTNAYTEIIFWYELGDARKALDAFHNYLIYKKVLMDPELHGLLVQADGRIREVLNAIESNHLDRTDRETVMLNASTIDSFRKDFENLKKLIDEAVATRLKG